MGKESRDVGGGITVRVYLESSSAPLRLMRSKRPNSSIKRSPTFYDRRAELLAYSRHLRTQQHSINVVNSDFRSKPRAKKWKWYLPLRKIQNAFTTKKDRACRYERIETLGMGKSCHPRSTTCNKAKTRISRLFNKLWTGCCRWRTNKLKWIHKSKW